MTPPTSARSVIACTNIYFPTNTLFGKFLHLSFLKKQFVCPAVREEEDLLPGQQEWSSRTERVKEEEEEADISNLPVIDVIVKSEDDEVRGESEEKREAEPPSSSPTEADGDHCGGSRRTDNTRFKISKSDKTFGDPDTNCHNGEKPFMCSVCGKGFFRNEHLITHTRTHTGEKPFICSVCGQRFSQKGSLGKHARTHTGEKPFPCSVCNTRFSDRSTLVRHTRRHTGEKPFSCSICHANFSHRSTLVAHVRAHTGEKPFPCSVCGKKFPLKTQLTRHMKIHAGKKVYKCRVCGEIFSYSYQLNNHQCSGENSSSTNF
nr:gastrula zinc finger protein XlCGF8.2DB-like [Nerophis lumbriciformis]